MGNFPLREKEEEIYYISFESLFDQPYEYEWVIMNIYSNFIDSYDDYIIFLLIDQLSLYLIIPLF